MKLEYFGTVKDGVLKIRNRKQLDSELLQWEGKDIEIIFQRKTSRRSEQQNKYYWVCVGLLADYTGYSKNEMHEIVKCKFLKRERVIENTGEVVEYLASTTSLKKMEFVEFMDRMAAWAGEMGCTLPPPNTQFELV